MAAPARDERSGAVAEPKKKALCSMLGLVFAVIVTFDMTGWRGFIAPVRVDGWVGRHYRFRRMT